MWQISSDGPYESGQRSYGMDAVDIISLKTLDGLKKIAAKIPTVSATAAHSASSAAVPITDGGPRQNRQRREPVSRGGSQQFSRPRNYQQQARFQAPYSSQQRGGGYGGSGGGYGHQRRPYRKY